MKMFKLSYMAIIAIPFFFLACNAEDVVEPAVETNLYTPVITGVMGELMDGSQVTTTKAGVIEENDKYAADGEKFYWMEGDRLKLLFFKNGNLNSTPTELIYKTLAPDGKSNKCKFVSESTGGLEEGEYTVYALYPADKWIYEGGVYKIKTMTHDIVQEDASSRSMGQFMYMKAKTEGVEIGPNYIGNENSFDLSFKQLASVVRFTITDPEYDRRTMKIKKLRLIVKNPSVVIGSQFFPMNAYLKNLDDVNLTTVQDVSCVNHLTINIGDNYPVSADGQYTLFLPVLPTREPTKAFGLYTEWMYIESDLDFHYPLIPLPVPYLDFFGTGLGLSFNGRIDFLNEGFKAGYSYYFNLKTTKLI